MRGFLLVFALLVYGIASPSFGSAETHRAVFVNGTLELATTFEEGGGPDINRMLRGDSPFDNLRLRLFGDVVLNDRFVLFNDFLIDPSILFDFPSFLRTYIRYTAFASEKGDLNFQAGKIPTPFGTFGARSYPDKNPVIGSPLMYHYFTSLRFNQIPANNADLILHRGEGTAGSFSGFKGGGASQLFNGMPVIYDSCWDFGLEAIGSIWRFEYTLAATEGTLSSPQTKGGDKNEGNQVAAHVGAVPFTGLLLGVSYARGPYLDSILGDTLRAKGKDVEDFHQEVWGIDAEYSVRHLKVTGEFAKNKWETPNIIDAGGRKSDLKNYGWYLEGKYTFSPGFFGAVRYGGLAFGKIDDGTGTGNKVGWDFDVRRWEFGLGYLFSEGVIGKAIWQENSIGRAGGPNRDFFAVQISALF